MTNLDLMCKYRRPFLNDKIDVPQGYILDFWFCRKKSYQRGSHLLAKISNYISTSDKFHLQKNHLHRNFQILSYLKQKKSTNRFSCKIYLVDKICFTKHKFDLKYMHRLCRFEIQQQDKVKVEEAYSVNHLIFQWSQMLPYAILKKNSKKTVFWCSTHIG